MDSSRDPTQPQYLTTTSRAITQLLKDCTRMPQIGWSVISLELSLKREMLIDPLLITINGFKIMICTKEISRIFMKDRMHFCKNNRKIRIKISASMEKQPNALSNQKSMSLLK